MTLARAGLVAFAAATDLDRARAFYEGVLGLRVIEQTGFACVLDAHGTTLRITAVKALAPAAYTVLGWEVDDVAATVDELTAKGVAFQRHDSLEQDERGIWTAPSGAQVAWFSDPDGNTLSVTQSRPRGAPA